MSRPAVFLDRDGTLIEDPGHLGDPAGVVVLPGVPAALRRLSRAGFALVVVSNQAGVARGLFGNDDVRAVNDRLAKLLKAEGAGADGWHWCPHHPDFTGPCGCRKPRPGMLERAAEELALDLEASWIVGDHPSDAEAGLRVGARAILVLTGHGRRHDAPQEATVVPDLAAAADVILDGRTTGARIPYSSSR